MFVSPASNTQPSHSLLRRAFWNQTSSSSLQRPHIMTAGRTCALPGCSKPAYPSSPDLDPPPLACGNLHHQLLMAGRFHPNLPNPYFYILDRNAGGLCALLSCTKPPYPGHSWCSRTHYCDWLDVFTYGLRPEQFCKIDGCVRHVFVEEDYSRWEFCGWHHRQKYAIRSAMPHQPDLRPRQQPSLPSQLTLSNEVECDHTFSVESLMDSLRMYAKGRKVPKDIKVDDDFFNKHPWEVCADDQKHLLIVGLKYKHTAKRKRVLLTKNRYHWKQQGRPIRKIKYTVKYFCYEKCKGNQADCDEFVYHMEECSVEDVEDYAVIKLARKARPLVTINSECLASKDCDGCHPNSMMQQGDEVPDGRFTSSSNEEWLQYLV